MSITLEDARKRLEILEQIEENPELIFSDLFHKGIDGCNFLCQVTVNGKHIYDCIKEYLSTLEEFSGCELKCDRYKTDVYMTALKYGEYKELQPDDYIMEINLDERTYKRRIYDIQNYEDILVSEYYLEEEEIPKYYEKFKDITWNKKLKTAYMCLKDNKDKKGGLIDFFYVLFTSSKKIRETYNLLEKRISEKNEKNLEYYNKKIERQNFLKEFAPAHLEKIRFKQERIANYLKEKGYTEEEAE